MARCSEQLELRGDLDRAGEATRHRTETGVEAVDPLRLCPAVRCDRQPIVDRDPLDDQDAILGLDLPDRFDLVVLWIDLDMTRLQRAGERARQSAASRGDHIVERRRMRWVLLRPDAVMLGNLGVHAEDHWLLLGGEIREALGATQPLDPDLRHVADVSHRSEGPQIQFG
jgi:hypothetical protein